MQIQTFGIFWAAYCGNGEELVVSVPAWQAHPNHVLAGPGPCEICRKPGYCPKYAPNTEDYRKTMTDHDRPVIWTSRLPERYPNK